MSDYVPRVNPLVRRMCLAQAVCRELEIPLTWGTSGASLGPRPRRKRIEPGWDQASILRAFRGMSRPRGIRPAK